MTTDGNIWIGISDYGLSEFDGVNWKSYSTKDSTLPSNNISYLYFDGKGNLWIGASIEGFSALIKFNQDSLFIYDSNNSALPNKRIADICEDDSSLWISTRGGLVKFDGKNWKLFNTSNSDLQTVIINDVEIDNQNNKWLATGKGLVKFDDSTFTSYYENTPLYQKEVKKISIDKNGNIWSGIFNGLVKFDLNNWTAYTTDNSGLPANEVDLIITDNDNNKWLGTFDWINNGRLAKFDEQNWTTFKTWKGDLNSNFVNFIKEDSKGRIWIGTEKGLSYVKDNTWKVFTSNDSISKPDLFRFNSFAEDTTGNWWFSVLGDEPIEGNAPPPSGLLKYDGKSWTEYRSNNTGLPIFLINKIDFSEKDNSLWLATTIGPVKFDGNIWTALDTVSSIIPDKDIISLKVNGNIKWFGTQFGLIKYDGTNWQLIDTSNSDLPDNSIYNITIDKQNNLWVSTFEGLAKLSNDSWTIFDKTNSGLPTNNIINVTFDKNNIAWIATIDDGVVVFDGKNWNNFNSQNTPIINNYISDIEIDRNENVWIGGSDWGISTVNENEIVAVEDENNQIQPVRFLLEQNYPNPFNPTTKIRYSIPAPPNLPKGEALIQLKVYDILGREVTTLVNENQQTGNYEVTFDGSNLASGVYLYQLRVNNFVSTKKLVLLK